MSSLYARLKAPGPSGFGYASTAADVVRDLDLTGRTFLLTGCNSGIGLESMRQLAARGARVIALARSVDKAAQACREVGGDTIPVACELADPESVLAAVDTVRAHGVPLDGLILNAGIMALPRLETAHGHELQFWTNHVGHFLLGTRLLDQLTPEGRVVVLSSRAHENAPRGGIRFDNLDGSRGYFSWTFYGQSKLANLLFARELGRRFAGTGRRATAVHPGVIQTNLGRHMGMIGNVGFAVLNPLVFKTIPQGAATQTWAAAHPAAADLQGEYLADCNVARSSRYGGDPALAARLWDYTEEILRPWTRT
jgi:WW domain-containing oxidoreductase